MKFYWKLVLAKNEPASDMLKIILSDLDQYILKYFYYLFSIFITKKWNSSGLLAKIDHGTSGS